MQYYDGIVEDITEHKRVDAERIRMVTAIEQAAEAVMITDAQGEVQYVNPAFTAITGYSRSEILGKNPRALQSGEQDAAFYEKMWRALRAGRVWHGEVIDRGKDGSLYKEEMTITPVRDETGEVTHFIAIMRDITAQKRLEEQFRQAQKMEAVGRLAAGVAHDFNNLLTIINGYSELMIERLPAQDAMRASATEIRDAGLRAAGSDPPVAGLQPPAGVYASGSGLEYCGRQLAEDAGAVGWRRHRDDLYSGGGLSPVGQTRGKLSRWL